VLPTGGDHFTSDVAVGLRTPIAEAEKIKKKYGCALATMISEDTIEVRASGQKVADPAAAAPLGHHPARAEGSAT
jgi:cell division protein FtsA